jgi:hypothetical protein
MESSTPDATWEAISMNRAANDLVSANYPVIRQFHVQPNFGLGLVTTMAGSTAAFVFISFGALVWHLFH